MKKTLCSLVLASSFVAGCASPSTYKPTKTRETPSSQPEEKRKGFLYWGNELLTGWVPGYGIIRFEVFQKDYPHEEKK